MVVSQDNTRAVTVRVVPKVGNSFYLVPYDEYAVLGDTIQLRRSISKDDTVTFQYTSSSNFRNLKLKAIVNV